MLSTVVMGRRTRWVVGTVVVYALASLLLPRGMPVEVLIPGLISGGLASFTAMGLVLIYRSARIINFAQANMGALAGTFVVLAVGVLGWSYWVAVPVGFLLALFIGFWVEQALLGPLREAPRLVLTVATIGVAQLLGGLTLYIAGTEIDFFGLFTIPTIFEVPEEAAAVVPFGLPFDAAVTVGSLRLTADVFVAAAAIPLVLLALSWYFNRTDSGLGARAAADSAERALLLGMPVRRLSLITWLVASVMSYLGIVLQAGVDGFQANVPSGPEVLLVPLAAAVIARFSSLGVAFAASVALGLAQRALFWSYSDASLLDLLVFGALLGTLLVQKRQDARVGGEDLGGFAGLTEVRPLPPAVAAMPLVRRAKLVGLLALVLITCVLPAAASNSQLTFFTFVLIFIIVATSLVLLAGWGGQISLGQFGFVALGAGTTGYLLVTHGVNLLACLLASTAVGALSAFLVGLPALRIRGLYLAAVTMAFAVPASTFVLNAGRFPSLAPVRVDPPILFGRYDLSQAKPFFYLCLLLTVIALGIARNFRASRIGRASITLRENERFGAAVSLSATRVRLTTFALSGALAGLAGGLYVLAYRGVPLGGFTSVLSFQAFTMVVVGGMGSLWGAGLGALYVYSCQYFLGGSAALLTTGGGVLLILTLAPGGLADLGYRMRDRLLGRILAARGLSTALLFSRDADDGSFGDTESDRPSERADAPTPTTGALLEIDGITAGYGHLQILFGISAGVRDNEIFALLGTNGAGKSTILKVVAGVLPATGGSVRFDGEDITALTPAERVQRGLVLVAGGRGVFGNLTVEENLRLAGWLARRRGETEFLSETTDRIYALFPVLAERRTQKAALMSGGEQQMLTIAQALLCRPRLLMIDELSLGLAPSVVASLLDVVRQLADDGMTIVLVEQSMNIAVSVAPRAIFLEKGQTRFTGRTSELASQEALVRSVFLTDDPARPVVARPALVAAEGPPVLEVRGVRRAFGGVQAVAGVDLDLHPGRILGVIGANGAGKTTLFDIVCGFVRADAGSLRLNGVDVTAVGAAGRFRAGLGRTFQDLCLVPSLTVRDVLAVAHERHIDVREPVAAVLGLPAALASEARLRMEVDELLDVFNLGRYANTFVSELSTGTRRIVELATVAAHRPSVIVLDEPSSGLAQKEAEAMVPLLFDLRSRLGASIAIIEHDIPMIRDLSDEVLCMHLGGVLALGPADEVLADPAVVAAYLGIDKVAVERSDRRAGHPVPPQPRTRRRPAKVAS
jgi:ABC-type branched-subunit amino acid transport system ATPase component/ABC-type branched-subunit amino acid transport system permease subunit